MQYEDVIYGKVEISEPIVLELLNSPSMIRLKKIDQMGYLYPFFPGTGHSRYEHSVGVYLLLKKFDAPFIEQVAGLLHDISHSVFSHCTEYVFDQESQKEQSYQDDIFDDYLMRTEIPAVLEKFNLDVEYILDDRNFPLKENSLPDICADRIDYALRDVWHFRKYASQYSEKISGILADLSVADGRWIFQNYQSARNFAELFFHVNKYYYSGIQSATMFRTTGDYLKYALKMGYIATADLFLTDDVVLSKINQHIKDDDELAKLSARMNNQVPVENDPDDFEARVICKSRVIDPLCISEGIAKRVSEVDEAWKTVIEQEMKPKEYFLRFLD